MITFIKKKLSYIVIIFFIVVSIKNLSKFNDFEMINIENDIENTRIIEESGDLSLSMPEKLVDKNYIRLLLSNKEFPASIRIDSLPDIIFFKKKVFLANPPSGFLGQPQS